MIPEASELFRKVQASPFMLEVTEKLRHAAKEEAVARRRFREDITENQKVEFINGEVVMHSPALHRHTMAVMNLSELMRHFCRQHGLGIVCIEKAMTAFSRNDYEPDIVYFGREKATQIRPDTLIYSVPDLIVEVLSPSTRERDLGVKCADYAAHGVGEYWVVDPEDESLQTNVLPPEEQAYPHETNWLRNGTASSTVLPGFVIPVRAVFDESAQFAALREIMR